MRNFVIVLISATVLVFSASCKQSSSPAASSAAPAASPAPATAPAAAAKSNDAVQQKLLELAGSGANNCGRPGPGADPNDASNCAMQASQAKRPFYVAYEMPGLVVGIVGAPDGKLYSVQADVPEAGQGAQASGGAQTAKVNATPCTAALRVAQSGRVTCMPPPAMGGAGGGSNPHGGGEPGGSHGGGMMAAPPGTMNPHGSVPTKPGTQNPHGGASDTPMKRSSS